jgi:hypothetical protein
VKVSDASVNFEKLPEHSPKRSPEPFDELLLFVSITKRKEPLQDMSGQTGDQNTRHFCAGISLLWFNYTWSGSLCCEKKMKDTKKGCTFGTENICTHKRSSTKELVQPHHI